MSTANRLNKADDGGAEEDKHQHRCERHDGYGSECIGHHTDEFGLSMILSTMFANYGEDE